MHKLRIFLADDHAIVRDGLKALINGNEDLEVVGEASDGLTACQQVVEIRPDVVVMDVSMPEMNGIKATEKLKQECPETKIVGLSVHEDLGYLKQLMHAGASGYVLKRAAAHELIEALKIVAKGGTYLDPVLASRLVSKLGPEPNSDVMPKGQLSNREEAVLSLIAQGYSNKEIAAQLKVSVKTIETYKARSMSKLGLNSRSDIVRYAVSMGWLPTI